MNIHAQKLSISLSAQQVDFMMDYQSKHHCKSRSDVIKVALNLLQKTELEAYYREANAEIDDAFDCVNKDSNGKYITFLEC